MDCFKDFLITLSKPEDSSLNAGPEDSSLNAGYAFFGSGC